MRSQPLFSHSVRSASRFLSVDCSLFPALHPYYKLAYIELAWGGAKEQEAEFEAGNFSAKNWQDEARKILEKTVSNILHRCSTQYLCYRWSDTGKCSRVPQAQPMTHPPRRQQSKPKTRLSLNSIDTALHLYLRTKMEGGRRKFAGTSKTCQRMSQRTPILLNGGRYAASACCSHNYIYSLVLG
jgi:hypothetical protein